VEQLSAMDASFLYIEAPTMPQHVLGVMLLDAKGSDGAYSTERFMKVLDERVHLMPAFQRRIVEVPLHLDHPYWVHDHDVRIEDHVHTATLPAPGDLRALGKLVGNVGSQRLRRDRPLWELWLVDGLETGQVAMVAKMHHSTIYGSAGADMMAHLLDFGPEGRDVDPAPHVPVEPHPSTVGLLSKAAVNGARRPAKVVKGVAGSAAKMGGMAALMGRSVVTRAPVTLPFSAPRTLINGRLTEARETAFTKVDFEHIREIKDAFGTKVNDVVLAAVTSSLRDYLVARDALPKKPMVASVPVNLGAGSVAGTDKISAIMVPLPVQTADPVDQLLECGRLSLESKGFGEAMGLETVGEMAELVPPLLMVGGSKLYDGFGLSRLHPPLQSLVVSNMPGPPIPLFLAGARVDAVYPFGPLLPGSGLNITVLSNMGSLDVGLIACPDLVPDLWELAEGFPAAIAELLRRARARA
jgi:diacylglycerol O-acyltransferase